MPKTTLIRYTLDDGTEVEFETTLATGGGEVLAGRDGGEAPEDERFEQLVQRIRPVAETVLNALKDFNTPQEIHLEFGVKLGGKTGIVFASASSECNFKIGLKWTNPPRTG